jgi:hypothetical protein
MLWNIPEKCENHIAKNYILKYFILDYYNDSYSVDMVTNISKIKEKIDVDTNLMQQNSIAVVLILSSNASSGSIDYIQMPLIMNLVKSLQNLFSSSSFKNSSTGLFIGFNDNDQFFSSRAVVNKITSQYSSIF